MDAPIIFALEAFVSLLNDTVERPVTFFIVSQGNGVAVSLSSLVLGIVVVSSLGLALQKRQAIKLACLERITSRMMAELDPIGSRRKLGLLYSLVGMIKIAIVESFADGLAQVTPIRLLVLLGVVNLPISQVSETSNKHVMLRHGTTVPGNPPATLFAGLFAGRQE